jgi:hypothetical protein
MTTVTLSTTLMGNGFQATIDFSDGVTISSAESYPTIGEAVAAAALKLLDMPHRSAAMNRSDIQSSADGAGSSIRH